MVEGGHNSIACPKYESDDLTEQSVLELYPPALIYLAFQIKMAAKEINMQILVLYQSFNLESTRPASSWETMNGKDITDNFSIKSPNGPQ